MNPSSWMRQVGDTKWLRQIVMPGSHDAGVYGTAQTLLRAAPLVENKYVVCQHSDFGLQAAAGSRFFDCRVFLKKIAENQRTAPDRKYANVLGHFAFERVKGSKQPTLGGYGGALAAVLGQALDFVLANTSEFVILRFSHTYYPDECMRQIREVVASKPAYANAVYKQSGNLAVKRVGELRGKVIMVFDEKFNHHITPTEGFHRFAKYSDGATAISGLATCGVFSSSLKVADVHEGAAKGVAKHLEHPGDPGSGHLHFIYWQQTAGALGEKDIFKTTSAPKVQGRQWTGGAHANLGDFAAELDARRRSSGKLPANVISHDFVTAQTCERIIRLNPDYPP